MRLCGRGTTWGATLVAALSVLTHAASAGERMADCRGERTVCSTLRAGEEQLASMLVSGDVSIVDRLFSNDAIWSLANGERWTKAEAIAALRKAPRMSSSRLLRASVRQHGTVAVVLWEESWHDPATSLEGRSFGTDTWMLQNARWQIIASQEARAPAIAAHSSGEGPRPD